MASSSGNSSGSTQLQNSGSEQDMKQLLMDQRKRKRMQSNRESARRSRMRKQKHLNDLMDQVAQLRKDNSQIGTSINITTQHYLNVEAENCVLRAQMMELTHRLDSLDEILNVLSNSANSNINGAFESVEHDEVVGFDCSMSNSNNPFNQLMHFNLPIMASPDLFHQY